MAEIVETKVRCPKCSSRDLTLTESTTFTASWAVRDGKFEHVRADPDLSSFDRLDALCARCNHLWKPRRMWQVIDAIVDATAQS